MARGAPTPLVDAALPVCADASQQGLCELDAAAMCRYLEELGDLHRPQGWPG